MSLLAGTTTERLPLEAALERLSEAARWASGPTLLWFAGLFYPGVIDAWSVIQASLGSLPDLAGVRIDLAGGILASLDQFLPAQGFVHGPNDSVSVLALVLPMGLLAARLSAGLASVAAEEERCGLGEAWQRGRADTRATLCIWALLALLLVGVLLITVLPLIGLVQSFGLREFSPLIALLVTPALLVVFCYAALLQIVQQLALHSLVHNRRGVSSALTHAWRLVRNAPWSVLRAAALDLILVFACLALVHISRRVDIGPVGNLSKLLSLAVMGYLGTVRATFWSRVYRDLGGQCRGDLLHGIGD